MSLSKPSTTATNKLSSQVSIDTSPLTPQTFHQRFSYVSTDAMAGPEDANRRSTQELNEEARQAERRHLCMPDKLSATNSGSVSGPRGEPDTVGSEIAARVNEMALRKGEDSSYSSMSSGDSCSSMPSADWEDSLKLYKDKMPPNIKMGYIDASILYCEDDRASAEEFRQHLVTEIEVENGPIIALLYDAPEMEALCGSTIQHLAMAVERSTYVFIYMTKNFIDDKWCEFSSESCLMEAITNPDKQWCVVPVYTEKRNMSFRVPMGLNTLKGINYYNNDRFYRKGVARLLGDKINVRNQANEEHKIKQKVWLENYKRKEIELKENQRRIEEFEEAKTQQLLNWLADETRSLIKQGLLPGAISHSASESDISSNLHSLAHSSSTSSLKPVEPQNPAVAGYFQLLLGQQQTYGTNEAHYSMEQMQIIEQMYGNASPVFHNPPIVNLYRGQGQMAPGQRLMAPGQGQIAPHQGQMAQGQGQWAPCQGQMAQGQGQWAPCQGQMAQGQGQRAPGQGWMAQGHGEMAQGQGQWAACQGQMAQGQGQMQPGQGQMAQGQGQMPPDQGEMAPGQGQMDPGHGQVAPGQGQMDPGHRHFPPVSSSASYQQQFQHHVKRSTSQASADMGPSTQFQLGEEEQQKYLNQVQSAAQDQQEQSFQHRESIGRQVPDFDEICNSQTSTNSSTAVSSGSSYISSNQSSRSLESNESNSFESGRNSTEPAQLGNMMDGNRHLGNLPNCSLLEQDAGSSYLSQAVRLEEGPAAQTQHSVRAAADERQSEDSDEVRSSDADRKKKEKMRSTHVVKHITYNIYQAEAVVIGDKNVVYQGDERVPGENFDGELDVRGATAIIDKKNTSIDDLSHRMKNVDIKSRSETHGEMLPDQPENNGASSAYSADAGPSTHQPVDQASMLAEPPVPVHQATKLAKPPVPVHQATKLAKHPIPVHQATKGNPVSNTSKMLQSIQTTKSGAPQDEKAEENIEIEETVPANKTNLKNILLIDETIEYTKTSKFEDSENLRSSCSSVKPSSGGQKIILPVKPILSTSSKEHIKPLGKARPVAAVPPQRHEHVQDHDDNCDDTYPKTLAMSEQTAQKNVPTAVYSSSEQTFVKQVWCPETPASKDAVQLQSTDPARDLNKPGHFDKRDSNDRDKFPISKYSDPCQLFFKKDRLLLTHGVCESNVDDGLNCMESSYSGNLSKCQEVVLGDDPLSRETTAAETPTSRSFIPQSSPFTTTEATCESDLEYDMLQSGNFEEAESSDQSAGSFVESGAILDKNWNKKGSPPGKKENKECVIS